MKRTGFTIVELLIVVAIIAALSVAVISTFQGSLKKGRDAQRKSDVKNISDALQIFQSDYGFYPPSDPSGSILACPYDSGTGIGTACVWGISEMADTNGTVYFTRLPKDPTDSQSYVYAPSADLDYFVLYANFEALSDSDSEKLGCTGGTCNGYDYFVASPNAPIGVVGALPSATPSATATPIAAATPTDSIGLETQTPTPTPTLPPSGICPYSTYEECAVMCAEMRLECSDDPCDNGTFQCKT